MKDPGSIPVIDGQKLKIIDYPLKTTFESEHVKKERFFILARGNEPKELFRICKVPLVRSDVTNLIYIADIIFTDIGLLLVSYGFYQAPNPLMMLGGIGMGIADSISTGSQARAAFKAYELQKPLEENWSPQDLCHRERKIPFSLLASAYKVLSDFLPGDEIGEFKESQKNIFEISCGALSFTFPDSAHQIGDLEEWRTKASSSSEQWKAAPQEAGFATLIEWAQGRPEATPGGIIDLVHMYSGRQLDGSLLKMIESAGATRCINLGARLRSIATPEAHTLGVSLLAYLVRKPGKQVTIGIYLPQALKDCSIGEAPRDHGRK